MDKNGNVIETLLEFANIAEKNRKYPTNSVYGIRAALKLFEQVLKESERTSMSDFKNNLDNIYSDVIRKNSDELSLGSLETYRKRILKVLKDYEEFGGDPSKLVKWNPKTRIPKEKKKDEVKKAEKETQQSEGGFQEAVDGTVFTLSLRPGVNARIITPRDMSKKEAAKIIRYLEYLRDSIEEGEENEET